MKTRGFTIVELLIVIVVIGILAAITIVAFNGVQDRAKNSQTTAALSAWIKALQMHKVQEGNWPSGWVCLGEGYRYGVSGTDTSGSAQCRQNGTSGYTENEAFNAKVEPFIKRPFPTPAFVTASNSTTEWRRGLMYTFGGGSGTLVYIDVAYAGELSSCPVTNGISAARRNIWNGNTFCSYDIGFTNQ